MKTSNRRVFAVLALSSLMASCYTTAIQSGKPADRALIEHDEKWHHGLVWGIAELSGPYDLKRICPGGWATIKTETSFLNGLVDAVTSGIYSPQSITVQCARSAASEPGTSPLPLPLPAAPADTPSAEPTAAAH